MGFMYSQGDAVPKDLRKALDNYERGCDMGDEVGCFALAGMYYNMKDKENAIMIYDKDCKLGMKQACENLTKLRGY